MSAKIKKTLDWASVNACACMRGRLPVCVCVRSHTQLLRRFLLNYMDICGRRGGSTTEPQRIRSACAYGGEPLDKPPRYQFAKTPLVCVGGGGSSSTSRPRSKPRRGARWTESRRAFCVGAGGTQLGGNGFISVRQQQLRLRAGNQNSLGGADAYSFSDAGE